MTALKTTGIGDYLLVGGYNLSGDTQSIQRVGGGPQVLEYTDITQGAHARQFGQFGGEINWTSFFDKGAGQAHPVLSALPTADVIVSYFHQPTVTGTACASLNAKQINYDPTRAADGSLFVAVAAQSNTYGLEWGTALQSGLRTDTTATSGASVDGAASTSFGLAAYLHVTAFSGTSVTVKLQDSADNSSWSDISGAAFTAVTAVGAQRISTATNATVRRYVRATTTGTFTSATFAVNFVRRLVTVVF